MTLALRTLAAAACWPLTRRAEYSHPGLRVLMYHRVAQLDAFDQLVVSPARFEAQMRQLARSRRVVGLLDGLRAVRRGQVDRPLVAVTFDDGYADNLSQAAPILLHYAIPATIFVTESFCDQLAVHPRYAGSASRVHLDWDEVARLAGQPGLAIGSHTRSHAYLPRLDDARALEEIAGSRRRIARRLGCEVQALCYPSGDVGAREARLAREAGYEAAVTVAPGVNRSGVDPMLVHRTEVTDRDDELAFALKLDGGFDPLHQTLHLRRRRRFELARRAARRGETA